MQEIIIKSKAEFEAALSTYTNDQVLVIAEGEFEISLTTSPCIAIMAAAKIWLEARGSSQPHVEAWENSQPHVVAWENSQPHVVARGNSQPHVVARGNSQPHVVAWGHAMLSLHGSGIVAKCVKTVYTLITGGKPKVTGGLIRKAIIKTAADWCDHYGVTVKAGVAVVYKALNGDFTGPHKANYSPGNIPVASDWDKGKMECGYGLHFSPSPSAARFFHDGATKYAACYVRLKDMRPPKDTDEYPAKIKAKGCCKPCVEVDINGKPVK